MPSLMVFGDKSPLNSADVDILNEIAADGYSRGNPPLGQTGVVIAGFGEDEFFPSVVTHTVFGITMNKAIFRYEDDSTHHVDGSRPQDAALIPFAQKDVVTTFMQGVDPDLMETILSGFEEILHRMTTIVDSATKSQDATLQKSLTEKLTENISPAMDSIAERIRQKIEKQHVNPLLNVLSVLPKSELADTAAALVELTAVKRKVSNGLETVGGPIDVAVISKGDGFVWISRKHYFDVALNPQFAANYYSE